jgi:hypothetical protein
VLIRSQASIISAGTERMLVDFGRANLLDKARQQPDRVKDVIDKARTDGLGPTYDAVRSKLDRPITLGYANAGVVLEVGPGVTDLEPGDVVASNGSHAEVVSVPRNLVVKVPEREGAPVPAEEAAFASIGAIALQGVRLAAPTLGERFVVTGLGLVGLLTVQLLRAQGCQVLGLDLDAQRLKLAEQFGAQTLDVSGGADPVAIAEAFSDGLGVDGVIVTASTKSSEPMRQAAQMCRKRGRLVLVGVTDWNCGERTSTRRSCPSRCRPPTGQAATTPPTRWKARTTRRASCAGPPGATSRRSSISSPTVAWNCPL